MDIRTVKEFKDWMRSNTTLQESSMSVYARTISRYHKRFGALEINSINKFISEANRDKHSTYIKYAFKPYLEFKGKSELYNKLVKVRVKPRKKTPIYLPDHIIRSIIKNIDHKKYRDISDLQYATAARCFEIITIKEENIDINYKPGIIRIRLEGKGGKERPTFVKSRFKKIIESYFEGKGGYIFLREYEIANDEDLDRVVNSMRRRVERAIKHAAEKVSVKRFATHDFRRAVIDSIRRTNKDPYVAKKVAGHSRISTTLAYFSDAAEEVEDVILSHQGRIGGQNYGD